MRLSILLLLPLILAAAEPDFPLTADSQPQPGVAKGELIKETYRAKADSVFPGTVREYQLYLPHGFDKTKPAPFMVFQDGVIYQAPVVFDNLIRKQDIPPLVGVFIRPGVVPAANDHALPRFNRSYEYDSVTSTYSRFLIEEFLPALEAKHGLKLSTDPNDAAIAGNSSGGICAFMAAWHRPDRFRRVFTGVGTYVGIHGAEQLPVFVRKMEPKPLRVFLQSGTGDNNLYCGDWWMANQMMERSLTWAGYDVNHAWGEGGHNQKHASQVFPDAMRWLWRDWKKDKVVKANPTGESKWKGYEVVERNEPWTALHGSNLQSSFIKSAADGTVFALGMMNAVTSWAELKPDGSIVQRDPVEKMACSFAIGPNGQPVLCTLSPKSGGETDGWNAAIEDISLAS
ncbi:MAG TPA: alpha/beta hydrolase-fold protein, partial [Prosthecobacter sp.]|nr:alpha/beta hydrolase-fold protein [Prosthecobacter sp.]